MLIGQWIDLVILHVRRRPDEISIASLNVFKNLQSFLLQMTKWRCDSTPSFWNHVFFIVLKFMFSLNSAWYQEINNYLSVANTQLLLDLLLRIYSNLCPHYHWQNKRISYWLSLDWGLSALQTTVTKIFN